MGQGEVRVKVRGLRGVNLTVSRPCQVRGFKGDLLRDSVWRYSVIKQLAMVSMQGDYPSLGPKNGLSKWLFFLGVKMEIVRLNGF